jgi:uncharacterized protein (DUF952 family)
MNRLVHICTKEDWQEALILGEYRPGSIDTDGFIHLSKPEQVLKVANAFYSGVDNLILLWIDPKVLVCEVRQEISDGQLFPHLYGPLNIDSVTSVSPFMADADGIFRVLPKENIS